MLESRGLEIARAPRPKISPVQSITVGMSNIGKDDPSPPNGACGRMYWAERVSSPVRWGRLLVIGRARYGILSFDDL